MLAFLQMKNFLYRNGRYNTTDQVTVFMMPLYQGTVVEGTIQQLFEGHHMNYIECVNVDYKSTRKESFYGIYGFQFHY